MANRAAAVVREIAAPPPVEQPVDDAMVEEIADAANGVDHRPPFEQVIELTIPFAQQEHDLLLKSFDKVATDWVEQLKLDRKTGEELEQMVIERLAKIKNEVTQLFLLGNAVVSKCKRDAEFKAKLTDEIMKLSEAA